MIVVLRQIPEERQALLFLSRIMRMVSISIGWILYYSLTC